MKFHSKAKSTIVNQMEFVNATRYTFLICSSLKIYDKVYYYLFSGDRLRFSYIRKGIIITVYMKKRQDIRMYFSAGIDIIQGGMHAPLIVA